MMNKVRVITPKKKAEEIDKNIERFQGSLWKNKHSSEVYILAQIDCNSYRLVSIVDGNRWDDVDMKNASEILTDFEQILEVKIKSDFVV